MRILPDPFCIDYITESADTQPQNKAALHFNSNQHMSELAFRSLSDIKSFACKLGYVLRRAQKVSSRLPGWPLDWEARASDPETLGLSVDVQQIRYVDMTGAQHEVSFEDLDGAFLDPLGITF